MSCNGICVRYKAEGNHNIPSRYKEGHKRWAFVRYLLTGTIMPLVHAAIIKWEQGHLVVGKSGKGIEKKQ